MVLKRGNGILADPPSGSAVRISHTVLMASVMFYNRKNTGCSCGLKLVLKLQTGLINKSKNGFLAACYSKVQSLW